MHIESAMYDIMLKPEEVTYHTYTSKEDEEEDFGMCEGMCQINKNISTIFFKNETSSQVKCTKSIANKI